MSQSFPAQGTPIPTTNSSINRDVVPMLLPYLANRGDDSMAVKLGELLVRQGILSEEQVEQILDEQSRGGRPFGDLAERLFGVSACDIEQAWVQQFAEITEHVDPMIDFVDPAVLDRITRRQAWQFGLLPMRKDDLELVVCTTRDNLLRAIRFAGWSMSEPVYFVLTDPALLEAALSEHYPFPGAKLMRVAS